MEGATDTPQWLVREDASPQIVLALTLRQILGVRHPIELPALRGLATPAAERASEAIENQWREYWKMTVEPRAHSANGPLELVDGYDTLLALPATGAEELRAAVEPYAEAAVSFARAARMRHFDEPGSFRAYASAIADVAKERGRPAQSFELRVEVLPFAQRGMWWIGPLTIAVTDGLRGDAVAFDRAIRPVISELA